ncbi:beta-galactosidase [Rathayibacter sp. VKM Ac-2760]|uniref:beta-galactosidase n=1 Tax=Rathayibacter sp. VKM Ac-2760 TaxID=2609253 RepID=UPI001316CC25|nr:beta-galactosidase [Rathayibacter sp. VKM Ac-2760]QHC58848.1 beta-galactosidase [Rathayibacter sp. VKM Ac-2760]
MSGGPDSGRLGTAGRITLDATAVRRDGAAWFPVMGEYHFSRDRPERWPRELRAMRAGGVGVVATYLIWILHEETRGDRRFSGHLDIRRFVEDARDAGLEVMLRIGPWAHGEARNGGFPDWLQALPLALRTNDPSYLAIVEDWFRDVAAELAGLFRDDAHPEAPIIGIQVDNELYDQREHLATLRELAERVGMAAPLWVATGWGGAQLPLERVAPVYAGYSDAFWESADIGWPPYARMHFEFSTVRDDLSVGADVRGELPAEAEAGVEAEAVAVAVAVAEDHRYPFLTCELGGGMTTAYHRRPHADPEDIAALALTKLGSGSAWQGYYLYHGTTQVTGELSGTQESHESGYPNDMPRKDYDFAAPIGASGTLRPHYHLLRRQHLFLATWGGDLTGLGVTLPPRGEPALRWALRSDERSGYVFVTNHQPAVAALPDVEDAQLSVEVGGRRVLLPSVPSTIPAGTTFFWPVRRRYGSIAALSATAQPITEIVDGGTTTVFFAAIPGIPVELELEGDAEVRGASRIETAAGPRWLPDAEPGPDCVVRVGDTALVILDEATSLRLYVATLDGRRTAVVFDGGLAQHGDDVLLERWTDATEVLVVPAVTQDRVGPFQRIVLPAWQPFSPLAVSTVRAESTPATVRTGGSMQRLSAPRDEDFAGAAVFEIAVPASVAVPDERAVAGAAVLVVAWTGDVLRAEIDGVLVGDQFWHGRDWELDLGPWRSALERAPLRLLVLPWDGEADVFVDARVRDRRRAGAATVDSARLLRTETVVLAGRAGAAGAAGVPC